MSEASFQEYREKAGTCADCGNSPVNHFETYWTQTFDVWVGARGAKGARHMVHTFGESFLTWLEPALYRFLAILPITRFAHDPNAASSYRSQVIWEEAARRGIRMEQMVILGLYSEIYRARMHGKWFYFQSLPIPPHLNRGRYGYIDDKFLVKELLAEEGIPVPRVVSATRLTDALEELTGFTGAVVVKPRSGSRARHTTVNVRTGEDLSRAFRSAQQLCKYVALETYLSGSVCRATVVDGKLVGFFQADPPGVTGDGQSTVEKLIAAKNETKLDRVQNILVTEEHEHFIRRLGYSLDSVLGAGVSIPLTHRTGRLFGGHTREMLGREHPKLRSAIEHAARVLKTPIVGFDLIIENPGADPEDQEWGIIEANSLPFIDLHYLPLEGTPSNVAAAVWDLWKLPQRSNSIHTRCSTAPSMGV